jgi:putative acetyltransferase
MKIGPEQPVDATAIHALVAGCFNTTAEATVIDRLRTAGRLTISLVAEVDGQIVGHVGFSPLTIDDRPTDGLGLAPLAVAAGHRRRGIGAALVNAGLDVCRQRNAGFAVVLGDPAYYGRFGFIPASQKALRGEFGGGDAFRVIEFREGALPTDGDLVRYAPEFAVVA